MLCRRQRTCQTIRKLKPQRTISVKSMIYVLKRAKRLVKDSFFLSIHVNVVDARGEAKTRDQHSPSPRSSCPSCCRTYAPTLPNPSWATTAGEVTAILRLGTSLKELVLGSNFTKLHCPALRFPPSLQPALTHVINLLLSHRSGYSPSLQCT